MIDMRGACEEKDFLEKLEVFKREKKHNIFVEPFSNFTNTKCPYCEVDLLNNLDSREIEATIDHYRPKKYYPRIKSVYQNYILMCNDCNNAYKGNEFLIYKDNEVYKQTEQVVNRSDIEAEETLIVNPIKDNIFDIFILKFKYTNKGKTLELYPKYTENDNKYFYLKAQETIKLFALGNCEDMDNSRDANRCRIILLKQHFNNFYGFLEALKKEDFAKASQIRKEKKLNNYGFMKFIKQKLFKVEV